jgi:hypothetical protein
MYGNASASSTVENVSGANGSGLLASQHTADTAGAVK